MKPLLLLLALCIPSAALATEPDAATKKEISFLIDHLASSGCRFNRNGDWYEAPRAVSHLKRKYEYLLKRKLVPNAEAFIEHATSKSSESGKPYLVKCNNGPEMQSAAWFREALTAFRAQSNMKQP